MRNAGHARRGRLSGCAIALLLLALSDVAAAAKALEPQPTGDGCAVVMPCCVTGFCPLARHPRPSRRTGPVLESCDPSVPAGTAVTPLRPPAVLAADLLLPPPAAATALAEPRTAHARSRTRAPETPPPDATR